MAKAESTPSRAALAGAWLAFAASAALVAFGLHLAEPTPIASAVTGVALLGAALAGRYYIRRRGHRLLQSGDLPTLLEAWRDAYAQNAYPKELEPLFRATTLAAFGLTLRARQVLSIARHGLAWESALEQRLLLDALLNAIDGDRQRAVAIATVIGQLPLPPSRSARARAITRRSATAAFARAFAQQSERGDIDRLKHGRRQNPLLAMPFHYAEVIAGMQQGDRRGANQLLKRVPHWPSDSAFSQLSDDIRGELKRSSHKPPSGPGAEIR